MNDVNARKRAVEQVMHIWRNRPAAARKQYLEQVLIDTRRHHLDTGSAEAQATYLTYKINKLEEHLVKNTRDKHSKKGLWDLKMKRRRILMYYRRQDRDSFQALCERLNFEPDELNLDNHEDQKAPRHPVRFPKNENN